MGLSFGLSALRGGDDVSLCAHASARLCDPQSDHAARTAGMHDSDLCSTAALYLYDFTRRRYGDLQSTADTARGIVCVDSDDLDVHLELLGLACVFVCMAGKTAGR